MAQTTLPVSQLYAPARGRTVEDNVPPTIIVQRFRESRLVGAGLGNLCVANIENRGQAPASRIGVKKKVSIFFSGPNESSILSGEGHVVRVFRHAKRYEAKTNGGGGGVEAAQRQTMTERSAAPTKRFCVNYNKNTPATVYVSLTHLESSTMQPANTNFV